MTLGARRTRTPRGLASIVLPCGMTTSGIQTVGAIGAGAEGAYELSTAR